MFAKTFGCVRFIYNKMLGDRLDYYKETGKKLNNTPAQYKEEFPWLKKVYIGIQISMARKTACKDRQVVSKQSAKRCN